MTAAPSIEPVVLGRILLIQSALGAADNETRLGEIVCHGLATLPGVADCALEITEAAKGTSASLSMDAPPAVRNGSPTQLSFALRATNRIYGRLLLVLSDPTQFAPYEPFVANTSNLVALHIETQRQAAQLASVNQTLEAQVRSRNKELATSRANLAALVDNTDDSIWSVDLDYRLIVGNLTFQTQAERASGQPLTPGTDVLAQDVDQSLLDEWRGHYDRAFRGEAFRIQVRRRAAPPYVYMDYQIGPIRGASGEVIGATVIGRDITRLHESEQEALRQGQLVSAIVDASTALIYIHDMENQINIYINTRSEEMLGYTPEQIRARGNNVFAEFIHPDDMAAVMAHQERLRDASDDQTFEIEYRMRHADGGWRAYRSLERPFSRNESGEVTHKLGVAIDVTESKKQQAALAESAARLHAVFQAQPVPAYWWQAMGDDFVLVDYNRAARGLTHDAIANQMGVKASDLHQNTPRILQAIRDCYAQRSQIEDELDYVYVTSGETRRLSVRYAFAPPDLVIVYTEDITDRERAARELRESEERFRQIYQQQAVGVARVSLDFRILGANRAYCDMLGYSEEELIGRSLADITLADDQAENIAQQTALGKGLIDHYRMEKRFVHRSGEIIMGVLDANLVHDADGQPAHFLGSVVDITELRRTMRELEQRNDELTRFNRAATGRELRMIELKQEINALCEQLGRQRPYPLEAMQSKEPR